MRRFTERRALPVVFAVLVAIAGCQETPTAAVYSVKEYDPSRDPAADLAATVKAAQAGQKRILLQVGGEWCGWCHKLDKYIATHPAVARILAENFIIMKVNYSDENENAAFLEQFLKIDGYPHWFVLESDGKFLHSQGTGELEAGDSYSEPTMLIFLRTWMNETEADQSRNKKAADHLGRRLFLFSMPDAANCTRNYACITGVASTPALSTACLSSCSWPSAISCAKVASRPAAAA